MGVFSRGLVAGGHEWLAISVSAIDEVDLSKVRPRYYWDGRGETWVNGWEQKPIAPGQW